MSVIGPRPGLWNQDIDFLKDIKENKVFIGGKFVELRITDADGSAASIHCQPQDKMEVGISDRILCIGGNRGLPVGVLCWIV